MALRFSWDEAKRQSTIETRALDFADVGIFFDGRPALHQESPRNDEPRMKTTASIAGRMMTVVWLLRGDVIHVISMRRAHDKEIRAYQNLHQR